MGEQVKYYRLTKTLNDVGRLVPFDKNVYDLVKDSNTDHYTSLFYYDDEHKKKAEETIEKVKGDKVVKRLRGVAGFKDVKTDRLVFDFDSEENVEKARKDTVELCKRLQSNGFELDKDVIIAFSGNKGFSVETLLEDEYTPNQIKKIASSLALNLESFDSKIYNASRVFRVMGTRHAKTGLYKTALSFKELQELSVDEIKTMASEPYEGITPNRKKLPENLFQVIAVEESDTKTHNSSPNLEIDFSRKPKNLSHWKYALLHGFFPNGCRSHALMILASTYAAQGYPREVAYRMLKGAVELQNERHGGDKFDNDEIWNNVIDQVYSPLWNGGTYAEESFPDELKEYLSKLEIPSKLESNDIFQNTKGVFDTFKNFAENIDANTIRTGIKPLDTLSDFRLTTGMLVGLLGAPSSGKTTVSTEIMRNVSLNGEQVAFFSMDMGPNLVFHRLAQKVSGLTGDKLLNVFKNSNEQKNKDQIEEIKEQIDEQFANVNFSFKTALNTEQIKQSIISLQEKSGKKVRLAVVDYLECIGSNISDPTAKISTISQELKDIAIELDICVLLLLQPPKRVGDPSKEILSYTDIKGAATVAQAASIILSLWRDGFNPKTIDEDNYISFAVIKNRMGKLAQVDCGWDGLTGKITTLDTIELDNLIDFRKAKANREKNSEEDSLY